ncbi:VirB4 family type IV secretion/conjugal transfer ATPase [Oxalobacteraceae bacterium A2-2]
MMPALVTAIAALGALMLALLALRLRTAGSAQRLARHRGTGPGLADLLNYAAVAEDGVIVCKNGALMAAWAYQCDDNAGSTDARREAVSLHLNQALARLGNGWMIHVDAVRRSAPGYPPPEASAFPDALSAAVDEERRRLFQRIGTMYEGVFVLTVTYFPPLLAQRKLVELMFDDDASPRDGKARTHGLIAHFQRECASLESRLSAALKLNRLRGHPVAREDGSVALHDDFLRWLQFCITGVNHPVVLPANPMYIDNLIGGQELWSGVVPRIGRKFVQVVAIDGFPLESTPGILAELAEQACEYRWSSRFIFLDAHQAVAQLEKYRKKWKQKIRGFFDQVFNTSTGSIDEDAASMANDAQAAIAETNSGLVTQGYYTSVVVLMDERREQLELSARALEKAVNRLGFTARVETINTMDAFLGSLPGHGVENVRRPLLNTLNLADLLPTSSIWTGQDHAPCPMYPPQSPALMSCVTIGSTPSRLNLHVRDLGHTLIFGPTRAGKSTQLAMIALQALRYPDMSLYIFDKGMSMYPVTRAVGGSHFRIGGDGSPLAFCPLQFLATRTDRAWAMEWIDTLLALNGVDTTPEQRNAIGEAVINMYESRSRTLSEFCLTVQDKDIRAALQQYTVDGLMGHLLDAESDGLELAGTTTFEIGELLGMGEKFALPVLLYLFRRIARSLLGQPAIIIIDEAWLMLGHPVFREKIREWLKAFAKANCVLLMATQSLSDAARSGILDVIIESTATRIYLPNRDARNPDAAALYRHMGLNERQIDIIAAAVPKRHYYAVSEQGSRLYELALGPLAMAIAGSTDPDSIAAIEQLEAEHGDAWLPLWLARKGLALENYGGPA